jgi:hypothetical protein
MVKIATIAGGPDNTIERIQSMKELDRALAYLPFTMPFDDAIFSAVPLRQHSTHLVSRNSHRTKGRKFASQKSRANRRKARAKK